MRMVTMRVKSVKKSNSKVMSTVVPLHILGLGNSAKVTQAMSRIRYSSMKRLVSTWLISQSLMIMDLATWMR